MLRSCKDGTYVIIAKSKNNPKNLFWIRLKSIDNAAIIPFNIKEKEKSNISSLIFSLIIFIFAIFTLIAEIKKYYYLGAYLSDMVAIATGALFPIVFIRNDQALSTHFCQNVSNWQKISSIRLIGTKKSKLEYLLVANNEEYIITLREKDLNKLRQAGIFF